MFYLNIFHYFRISQLSISVENIVKVLIDRKDNAIIYIVTINTQLFMILTPINWRVPVNLCDIQDYSFNFRTVLIELVVLWLGDRIDWMSIKTDDIVEIYTVIESFQ